MITRTYWKLRLNHNRLPSQSFYEYVFLWVDEPLPPEEIPHKAVQEGMLIDTFLRKIDQVCLITKEEYSIHMWD